MQLTFFLLGVVFVISSLALHRSSKSYKTTPFIGVVLAITTTILSIIAIVLFGLSILAK